MEFFAAALESTGGDVYQASGQVNHNAWYTNNEPDTFDTGWVQSEDAEEFNNFVEEY